MRQSVSAVLRFEKEIFFIKRQNYLKVFPGYDAFPGGKVDREDDSFVIENKLFSNLKKKLMGALFREVAEELNLSLLEHLNSGNIKKITHLGIATTPEFNPYRFENHYFEIEFNERPEFTFDPEEIASAFWGTPRELIRKYENWEALCVPPMITLMNGFINNLKKPMDLNLVYDHGASVPVIESLYGVKQFLPLSNTFPPASRTNCFLLGDEKKVLVDPSPKNELEFVKLKNSLSQYKIHKIFLTHHHPDHHEKSPELARELGIPIILSGDSKKRIEGKWGKEYFEGINLEIVKEGDILTKVNSHDLVIYEVPGHDEGQLALAPRGLEWFLVGDLIQTVGTVVIGGDEGDMKKYFSSLEKIIKLDPTYIIPSHGICMGGTNQLQKTLEHRKMREKGVLELWEKGKNLDEILHLLYSDLDEKLLPYALATIKSHLIALGKIKKSN